MKRDYFSALENQSKSTLLDCEEFIQQLGFNESGLVPVIAQDYKTKDVLMLAWMNKEALQKTLETGRMTYWSRSRQSFWVKGETSGNVQTLRSMQVDCDGDAVLCLVSQKGGACHTGRRDCFYFGFDTEKKAVEVMSSAPDNP